MEQSDQTRVVACHTSSHQSQTLNCPQQFVPATDSDTTIVPAVLSLFSGAGGMDLGFLAEGFVPILALDHDRSAVDSYNAHVRPGIAVQKNLATIKYPFLKKLLDARLGERSLRGVIGGPPCQGFSVGNAASDPGDERNRLPLRFGRILDKLRHDFPIDFFVMENVAGLRQAKHNARYQEMTQQFEAAGFRLFVFDLNAVDFGVPQRRQRLFIVGIDRALAPLDLQGPEPVPGPRCLRDVIDDLPVPAFFDRALKPADIPHHPNHWTTQPRSPRFTSPLPPNAAARSFRQLSWDAPSPTVAYGNREIHVHPNGQRRLSVFEAMMLQGFPASFVLHGTLSAQFSQVSNAVPPPLARAVARLIRRALYSPPAVVQKTPPDRTMGGA